MRATFAERHAVLSDGAQCWLYLADVTAVDIVRAADLERIGLSADIMRAVWRAARRLCVRADLLRRSDLTETPILWLFDGSTGELREEWVGACSWPRVLERLRTVHHAA